MKRWFLLLIIFTSFSLSASHVVGGEITYEYLSTNPNGSHQYKINLQIYRDISGASLSSNQTICVSSSCFGQQTAILTLVPVLPQNGGTANQALPVPYLTRCVNPNDTDLVLMEIYFFSGIVTLQGNCSDWKFSFHGSGRNVNKIDNLDFLASGGAYFYIETLLNNTIGQNTSPKFISPAARSFCIGTHFNWSHATIEPDNDSLRYTFGTPMLSSSFASCNGFINSVFSSGYSVTQPMTTVSGINLDESNGIMSFTPNQIETDAINLRVEEYRYDTIYQIWRRVSTTTRDIQVPIVAQCSLSNVSGIKVNTSTPGFSNAAIDVDSIRNFLYGLGFSKAIFDSTLSPRTDSIGIIDYSCGDSVITLNVKPNVVCSSISPDGTEFRLIGPDSLNHPITGVTPDCNHERLTNSIALHLHLPLDKNGDYYLQIKNGNDGNTFVNECGFGIAPFYTMKIRVENCLKPLYQLENVSVLNDSAIQINWSFIDSTINNKLFNSWNILRSNNNQFYSVGSTENYYDTNFIDTSAGVYEVDNIEFKYAVQLIQNFSLREKSNTLNNILLTATTNDNKTHFEWSTYSGWPDPYYELKFGHLKRGSISWVNLNGPKSNPQSFDYTHPEVDQNTSGIYAFKVTALDIGVGTLFTSESNWVYLEFKEKDPPQIGDVPNIFTPNGDSQNDRFSINNNTYSNISISIFNRWGKLVFQDIDANSADYKSGNGWDGTDINTGTPLADGVYYYIISASDQSSSKREDLKGSLTLMRCNH